MYYALARPHQARRAFTILELVVAIAVMALFAGLLVPVICGARLQASESKAAAGMKKIHMGCVIFGEGNKTYFPGLDNEGKILPATSPQFAGLDKNTLSGAAMSARYYILLKAKHITVEDLVSPQDSLKPMAGIGIPGTNQFSYALLRIGESATGTKTGVQAARAGEWRDDMNSRGIFLVDRNTGPKATPEQVRSIYSPADAKGAQWSGHVVWGDNHADFLKAKDARLGSLRLETKYGKTINSNDFLFGQEALPGKDANESAMFGFTSDNY